MSFSCQNALYQEKKSLHRNSILCSFQVVWSKKYQRVKKTATATLKIIFFGHFLPTANALQNVLMVWWSICHWCLQTEEAWKPKKCWGLNIIGFSRQCIIFTCDAMQSWHRTLWAERPKFKHAKKQSAAVSPGASDLETSVEAASGRLFSDGQSRKFEEKWTTFEMVNGMTKERKHFELYETDFEVK